MLKLLNNNIENLKVELNEAKALKTSRSSAIEKRFANNPNRLQSELKKNHLLQLMYTPSKTLPVRVEGLTINFKLYEAFMKKLKGFETNLVVTNSSLRLEYWKFGRHAKGFLELNDITPFFNDFQHIPVARVDYDKEA